MNVVKKKNNIIGYIIKIKRIECNKVLKIWIINKLMKEWDKDNDRWSEERIGLWKCKWEK